MDAFLKHLSAFAIRHFWKLWGLVPIILIIYGVFYIYKYGFRTSVIPTNSEPNQTNSLFFKNTAKNRIVLGLFLAFLSLYIVLIIYQESFGHYDESQYLLSTLRGVNYDRPIWLSQGRFWPLGHQEFNLIGWLTQSPTGYHLLPILQLLIVVAALFIFLIDFPIWYRITLITIIAIAPSFVISFFGLVYPERNIIFWLVILLLCFQYFLKTRSHFYVCGALISAQFALYYKEPMFLIIGGFAITRLLLEFFYERTLLQTRDYKQFFKNHCIEFGLIILTMLFLSIYITVFLPYLNYEYASSRSLSVFSTLVSYLKFDLLLDVFLITFISRFIYLIYIKQLPDPFWDSLAVGAFLYFLSYLKLQIFNYYYMTPVDFIAVLYIGQLVYPVLKQKKLIFSTITGVITLLIFSQNAAYSYYQVAERKNFNQGKLLLSEFLKKYHLKGKNQNVSLFFPFSSGYSLMEFSAFLEHKGIKLAKHDRTESTDQLVFTFNSPSKLATKNRCVDYVRFMKCFPAKSAQSGDLIVILPNDRISSEKFAKIQQESVLLFYHQPIFPLPLDQKIRSLFLFEAKPDTWFHVYVFQKL